MEVIGVEVFVRRWGGEEEVEEFEDEELEGGLAFAVEEEDDVFAKGFVGGAVGGEGFDDFVGELGWGGGGLGGVRGVGGDHVLFVQNELGERSAFFRVWAVEGTYQDSNNRIVVWIVHVI